MRSEPCFECTGMNHASPVSVERMSQVLPLCPLCLPVGHAWLEAEPLGRLF